MDSLTQIVLGAAVGEATLGRKIGSRAMLWGAFAGFLPDFDVGASFVMDEISALAVHRGISHSIFFAVFFSFLIAWLVKKLYDTKLYQKKWYKITGTIVSLGLIGFTANYLPFMVTNRFNIGLFMIVGAIGIALFALFYFTYINKEQIEVKGSYKDWYLLFFLAIITHPLLDCFTAYGTQVFLPFSNYRVAFNVISVADPLYTFPFLAFLLIAAFMRTGTKERSIANWLGIIVSSAYMLFCFTHKLQVNKIFKAAFEKEGIAYTRFRTTPIILNNFLWQSVAETEDEFYQGYYTFMQDDEEIAYFNVFPKDHELLSDYEGNETLKTLRWFSNDYYNVIETSDSTYQLNDVRYGIIKPKLTGKDDYIFKFILTKKGDDLEMAQSTDPPDITKDTFKELWERIMAR